MNKQEYLCVHNPTMDKDFIVVGQGYDEYYIPKANILYIKGSTAHGSGDTYIIRLVNGEDIEQKGFQAFRARMVDSEKFLAE